MRQNAETGNQTIIPNAASIPLAKNALGRKNSYTGIFTIAGKEMEEN